jgi:LysR family glycine cleavage system transcriptional activator
MHPGIDLRVSATMHHVDFAREDVDLAVRHGVGEAIWQGLAGERLATETLFAVCTSTLLCKKSKKLSPADVLDLPLLHLDEHSGWKRWLDAAQVKAPKPLQGVVLNRASMVIDAAINGQGIGLARSTLAAWDLINKRLIAPFSVSLPLTTAYWIVAPQATAELPKLVAGRDGRGSQAARCTRRKRPVAPHDKVLCAQPMIQFRPARVDLNPLCSRQSSSDDDFGQLSESCVEWNGEHELRTGVV